MLRGPCAFEYRLYQPRLYFITAGSVLYRGDDGTRESLGPGRCWGASDVLSLQSHVNAFRAVAASFLHVQWIGPEQLRSMRATNREPFRHLRVWAMLHDVATYLLSAMKKMPPALAWTDTLDDESGKKKTIVLESQEDVNGDPVRASLIVGGEKREVRFREKDLKKLWGKSSINPAWFGPLEVDSVDDSRVGGIIKLKDGRSIPNPRLLESGGNKGIEADASPRAAALLQPSVEWTPAALRETPTAELWKLKRAIDAVLEEKLEATERSLARPSLLSA